MFIYLHRFQAEFSPFRFHLNHYLYSFNVLCIFNQHGSKCISFEITHLCHISLAIPALFETVYISNQCLFLSFKKTKSWFVINSYRCSFFTITKPLDWYRRSITIQFLNVKVAHIPISTSIYLHVIIRYILLRKEGDVLINYSPT